MTTEITPTTPEAVRFPVFKDTKGNRFVFPGLYNYEDRRADTFVCLEICLAVGVTLEPATFDVVPKDNMLVFPRLIADAASYGFRHGGETVWLIGGPMFEDIGYDDAD